MKTVEFERLLVFSGFVLVRNSKHRIWAKDEKRVAVPNHKLINKMIARRVLKEIGYIGRVSELNFG